MKRTIAAVIGILMLAGVAYASNQGTVSVIMNNKPNPVKTVTVTPTPSPSVEVTPVPDASTAALDGATPTPEATPDPTPSPTPTKTPMVNPASVYKPHTGGATIVTP